MSRNGHRKKNKEESVFEFCKGVTLLNSPEITRQKLGKSTRSLKELTGRTDSHGILSKCVLEVLVVWGAMVGFLTSIECAYNVLLIMAAYTAMALFFSSIFKSGKTWVRDIWYVAFFVLFVGFVVVFRKYINSGFYAMINEFLDHVTDYYGASEVKVFSETIEDRGVTVPIAAIAIGSIQIIILNIFLNNSMSVLWTVTFTLPIYIAPLFFRLEPDVIPMIMGIAGMVGVICLKGNRRFRIMDTDSTFESNLKKRRLVYRHSDRASLQLVAEVLVVCAIVFALAAVIKPINSYIYRYRDSSVKKEIEAPLGNLIMYGFESLRNTANTGGLASGRLGGVSDVSFDGETDLTVRFAPYSAERIYLRAFVGDEYSWDHWDRDQSGTYISPEISDDVQYGIMDIQNIDGMGNLLYYPYYTEYEESLGKAMDDTGALDTNDIQGYDDKTRTLTVRYSPSIESEPKETEVDDRYLLVPEINQPVVAEFCEKAGINDSDSVDERIQKVYNYFFDNYPYTLHPGATPSDEDYVNYFLQTTKKGLCANYATAGALILRYLGIPTRYIEGYAVDYTDVVDSAIMDELKYEDYFHGDSALGRTAVVSVDVTDSSAHAWMEAFIDGRWQVIELTPPSGEEEDEDVQDFWTRLGRWLAGNDDGNIGGGGDTAVSFSLNRYSWVLYAMLGCVILAVVVWICMLSFRKVVRIRSFHGSDINENIVAYYRYMCDYARMAETDFWRAGSYGEQLRIFMPDAENSEIEDLANRLEKVAYGYVGETGHTDTCDSNLESMLTQLKYIMRRYRKAVPIIKRIYLYGKL